VIRARFRDPSGLVTDYEEVRVELVVRSIKLELQNNVIDKDFNTVQMSVYIKEPADVEVKIYEITGEMVCEIWEGFHQGGILSAAWDGKNDHGRETGHGVYILMVKVGSYCETRKIIMEK